MAPKSGGYYILSVTSEDKVTSRLKLLPEGVLFFPMRKDILLSSFRMGYFKHYFCHTKKQTKAKLD